MLDALFVEATVECVTASVMSTDDAIIEVAITECFAIEIIFVYKLEIKTVVASD